MYYLLEPEVAGQLGENTVLDTSMHPPLVHELHYSFDGWLGDDLLESFPSFIVTSRLREAIEQLSLSGIEFSSVQVSRSPTFEELHPDMELPAFHWLRVQGDTGTNDFSLSKDHILVVSEQALECLLSFNLNHCTVKPQ